MSFIDERLVSIRKHLHSNPEFSGKEYKTANAIAEIVSEFNPTSIKKNIGGTGVLVEFDSGVEGPTIMFRSELDALPIMEINEFDHRSIIDNVSHKCGHDGHSTILIGLAKKLSEHPFSKGKIVLLFQPAEENGDGAKAVLSDKEFDTVRPDYVFAFHNLPGYPMHQVVVRNGSFTAAVISLTVNLYGTTSHAAEPEKGNNPALSIARILSESIALSNNKLEQDDFCVVTPIHVDMGSIDYGISAGYGEVRLTLRAWNEDVLSSLTKKVEDIIKEISKSENIRADIELSHHFSANQNDPNAVNLVYESAIDSQLSVFHQAFPFKWGEDFGLFTQNFKGAMFGIGAGENSPALHNPDYDFPDEIIETGVKLFYKIASKVLS